MTKPSKEKLKLEAHKKELTEVEQILGKALGYPWYADDLENFPDATEEDGVCVGDSIPASLADDAADKIASLRRERDELKKSCKSLATQGGQIREELHVEDESEYDPLCSVPTIEGELSLLEDRYGPNATRCLRQMKIEFEAMTKERDLEK